MRLLTLAVLLWVPAWGQKVPSAHQAPAVTWKVPPKVNPADYVGAQICTVCHTAQAREFGRTLHASAAPAGAPVSGCEACHGPGKAHAEAMGAAPTSQERPEGKTLIFGFHAKSLENAARCQSCHSSSADLRMFERSGHKLLGISCEQCHSAHLVTPAARQNTRNDSPSAQAAMFNLPSIAEESRWLSESLLRQKQPDLCFGCHKSIQALFALPTHHRVPEGLMKCTDCHEAHGTLNNPNLRKVNFEVCTTCHSEKRGPFVHEHAAVKVEGCTACHGPHGTVERNLLLRREGRFLCLQCHVNPAGVNVPHGRLSFATRGECVRCHAAIHGSNTSPYFLQ